MKNVLLILSKGFEEIEVVVTWDLLRRAEIAVVAASAQEGLLVEGSRGIRVQADKRLADCLMSPFDMVVLPGGPGVEMLRKDARVLDLVRRAYADGIPLAAICAAPAILADAGIARPHKMTSFPGSRPEVETHVREYSEERVVVDGKVITSRGAGTAEEFGLRLVEYLVGKDIAEDVRRRIVAR